MTLSVLLTVDSHGDTEDHGEIRISHPVVDNDLDGGLAVSEYAVPYSLQYLAETVLPKGVLACISPQRSIS